MSQHPGGNGPNDPHTDFPIRERVEDASGRQRTFFIDYRSSGLGFTVTAEEEGKEGLGYQFSAFSETSPYNALGTLRWKMRRALAMRHITWANGQYQPLHETLRGRITVNGEGEMVLVVDGMPLTLEDLRRILAMHEGWDFRLKIADYNEDVYT